jgi:FlaG/FlaF family flagellin (archaellin)
MVQKNRRCAQRGMSLFSMALVAIVVCLAAVVALRVLPTVNEFAAIKTTLNRIVQNRPSSAAEVQAAFDRQRQVENSIVSIGGTDLEVNLNGQQVEISFAYDKEVEIYGPVFLLIKYRGTIR